MHAQGSFVVLKLLEVAEPMDCMPLAGVLLPQAIAITAKKQFHGLEIMLKLVFKIVSAGPYRGAALSCHASHFLHVAAGRHDPPMFKVSGIVQAMPEVAGCLQLWSRFTGREHGPCHYQRYIKTLLGIRGKLRAFPSSSSLQVDV